MKTHITYAGAVSFLGLIGMALYQFSQGHYDAMMSAIFAAFAAAGLGPMLGSNKDSSGPKSPFGLLVLLAILSLPTVTHAQCLPWRRDVQRRITALEKNPPQQQQQAPAPLMPPQYQLPAPALPGPDYSGQLSQIIANQQSEIAMLQQIAAGSPSVQSIGGAPYLTLPITPGQRHVLPIAGAPQQVLPIAGAPLQILPIQGSPLQILPIQGVPQQQLPIAGVPQQVLPVAPTQPAPLQVLPIAPAQPTPAPPSVAPIIPAPSPQAAPPQQLPITPRVPTAPMGYQRYTTVKALWR